MLKLIASCLMIVLLFAVFTPVSAEVGDPIAGCPRGYSLVHADHTHEGEHMHHHIGTDVDRNGDGWICERHVGSAQNNHVHFDNYVPLP